MASNLESFMRHLTESKENVTFQIVADNAKLLSQIDVDNLRREHSERPIVRRYHSQPIMPKSFLNAESKASSRWAASPTSCPSPLNHPARSVEEDRWRVGRNHSDSSLHSPPKRRHSPILTYPMVPVDDDIPAIPALPAMGIRERDLQLEVEDVESQENPSQEAYDAINSRDREESQRFIPLISRIAVSLEEEEPPLLLAPFLNVIEIIMMWPIWSSILRIINLVIFDCKDDQPASCQRRSIPRPLKKETLRNGGFVPIPQQPSSTWEPYTIL
jgi:hypothetical protein